MPSYSRQKALGQNFLVDHKVCSQIVEKTLELVRAENVRRVVEIGPGKKALTALLEVNRPKGVELLLCEKDRHFIENLKNEGFTVAEGDFLDLPEERWLLPEGEKIVVVSNLPYSVGTTILTHLTEYTDSVAGMVLMFQKEVAERLFAKPGTKAWGSLSIWVQNNWTVEPFLLVPPRAFRPAPKIDSMVVVLRPRPVPQIPLADRDLFEQMLKVCFQHRRKMLRSGLPKSGPWQKALEVAQLDGTNRAEKWSWPEWTQYYQALLASSPKALS